MRNAFWLTAALTLSGLAPLAGDEPDDASDKLMQAKLKYSEQVLTGLVNKDFDAVGEAGDHLRRLGHLERWTRAFTPEYQAQLEIYRTAINNLVRNAKEENLDGATLAFVQITVSCVHCHKVVRDPEE